MRRQNCFKHTRVNPRSGTDIIKRFLQKGNSRQRIACSADNNKGSVTH